MVLYFFSALILRNFPDLAEEYIYSYLTIGCTPKMVENSTFLTSVNMNALFFCITGSCFTLKHEHCSVTGYTYF